jgi:hypothetical protein
MTHKAFFLRLGILFVVLCAPAVIAFSQGIQPLNSEYLASIDF